ncbi:MAG: DNA polymerase III subunit gamma/tau [Mongoliibacter sp.]|nr:MAG: DNA polymerase III subunit gamma/tau [Mongoliibacter sp.]
MPTSLSAAKKNVEEKRSAPPSTENIPTPTVEKEPEVLGTDDIDKNKIQDALDEIIEEFKTKGKSLEITVLKQPFILEDQKIKFKLMGEIQEDVFQKMKPELLKQLRQKLNNATLLVHAEITEETDDPSVRKLYTNSDKFSFLLEKSPALKELQKRFGLETDF